MKNNYPIKYAIMPIYEHISANIKNLTCTDTLPCHIVSKCYLLGESKSYLEDGDQKYSFDVFFPYEQVYSEIFDFRGINSPDEGKITTVDIVFDTYATAREYADMLNAKVLENNLKYLSKVEDVEIKKNKIKNYYKMLMAKFQILERKISDLTDDMAIDYVPKNNKIVIEHGQSTSVVANSVYQFLNFVISDTYAVYNVSDKDMAKYRRKEITKLPEDKLVLVKYEPDFVRLNCQNNEDGIFIIKDDNISFKKGLMPVGNEKCHFKVYTTETFDEIVTSYSRRQNINLKEIFDEHNRKILTNRNVSKLKK